MHHASPAEECHQWVLGTDYTEHQNHPGRNVVIIITAGITHNDPQQTSCEKWCQDRDKRWLPANWTMGWDLIGFWSWVGLINFVFALSLKRRNRRGTIAVWSVWWNSRKMDAEYYRKTRNLLLVLSSKVIIFEKLDLNRVNELITKWLFESELTSFKWEHILGLP